MIPESTGFRGLVAIEHHVSFCGNWARQLAHAQKRAAEISEFYNYVDSGSSSNRSKIMFSSTIWAQWILHFTFQRLSRHENTSVTIEEWYISRSNRKRLKFLYDELEINVFSLFFSSFFLFFLYNFVLDEKTQQLALRMIWIFHLTMNLKLGLRVKHACFLLTVTVLFSGLI